MSKFIRSPHAQGTPEWLADRAGRLNGSEVAAIYATIKSGEAAARRDLRLKMVLERLTGAPQANGFVSADMQWGTDHEPEARRKMESATGLLVEEVGYCYWPHLMIGASPDGLMDDDGKVGFAEFKCPKSNTHLGYLTAGVLPADYVPQIMHNFLITGAQFCIFQSFDPRFPEKMQTFRIVVERSELDIAGHERMVLQFLKEVDAQEREMRAKFDIPA